MSGIRSVRSEMNVPPAAIAPLVVVESSLATKERLERHAAAIRRLARVDAIDLAASAPKGSAQIVIGEATVCLPLGSLIDLSAERTRLEKAVGKVEQERERILGKLSNEKFVANARPDVVEAERERLAELDQPKGVSRRGAGEGRRRWLVRRWAMAVHAQPDGMWDKMIRKGGFDRLFPFYVILVRLPENGRNGSICPRLGSISHSSCAYRPKNGIVVSK